jgi:hypothetical protein
MNGTREESGSNDQIDYGLEHGGGYDRYETK